MRFASPAPSRTDGLALRIRGQLWLSPTLRSLQRPWRLLLRGKPAGRAGVCAWDIPGCARCGTGRIGEASHPGPRGPRKPRAGDLESRPVQSSTTLVYEERLWEDFVSWCRRRLSDSCLVFSPLSSSSCHGPPRLRKLLFFSWQDSLWVQTHDHCCPKARSREQAFPAPSLGNGDSLGSAGTSVHRCPCQNLCSKQSFFLPTAGACAAGPP